MKIGEAREYLEERDRDLAAEHDPDLKTWYEQESRLQPEYLQAVEAREMLGRLAGNLGRIHEAMQAVEQATQTLPEQAEPVYAVQAESIHVEPPAADSREIPAFTTPKQQELQDNGRLVDGLLTGYEQDMAAAQQIKKKGKRQHQEKMAARKFVAGLNETGEPLTEGGGKHAIGNPELVELAMERLAGLPGGEPLKAALAKSSHEFANRHAGEIFQNPRLLAKIVTASCPEYSPNAAGVFDEALKGLFEDAGKSLPAKQAHVGMANALMEIVDKQQAMLKGLQIVRYDSNGIIPSESRYNTALTITNIESYKAGWPPDGKIEALRDFAELMHSEVVYLQIASLLWGVEEAAHYTEAFRKKNLDSIDQEILRAHLLDLNENDFRSAQQIITNVNSSGARLQIPLGFESVTLTSLVNEDEHFEIDQIEMGVNNHLAPADLPSPVLELTKSLPIYQKRLRELSPVVRAKVCATKVLREAHEAQTGEAINDTGGRVRFTETLISPSLAIVSCFWRKGQGDLEFSSREEADELVLSLVGSMNQAVSTMIKNGGLPPKNADLALHHFIGLDNVTNEITAHIIRPATMADIPKSAPANRLVVSVGKVAGEGNLADYVSGAVKTIIEEKQALIKSRATRFLGRRPIRFGLGKEYKDAGLQALKLSRDKGGMVRAVFEHDEGPIDLNLTPDLRIIESEYGGYDRAFFSWVTEHAEKIINELAAEWSCRPVVHTSEGVMTEESDGGVNVGHFAYQRVKDGTPWGFTPKQARIFLEEQGYRGTTLAEESFRRRLEPRAIDPATGLRRNSTYVRESYDPDAPPLEVYLDLSKAA